MTTNNNGCVDNKLNEFIFNTSVSIHLFTYKYNSVKDILEYSLLSKRCFKIFQNLIITSSLKFIFPINNFIKYIISNDNNNNNTTYINQLIQYKHIERIKIKRLKNSMSSFIEDVTTQKNNNNKNSQNELKKQKDEDEYDHETFITQICKMGNTIKDDTTLKIFLNHYCPCLKETTVISELIKKKNTYENDNFFKFNKLSLMYFDKDELPISNDDINPLDEESYEYSFSFISSYNPLKVYISSLGDEIGLELKNVNNLLNFKSIKSIYFNDHFTPSSFITKVFQSSTDNSNSNLRSLYLNMEENNEDTLFDSEIHSNKTIKKLILKRYWQPSSKITEFLQLIKSNSTISTLGLHYFNIENSDQLSPLIQMKNINCLYCFGETEIVKVHLDHCNYNSNIKKLVIIERPHYKCHDEMIGIFENFIKNNNSSLQIITFIFVRYTIESLIKSFNNYNNNEMNNSKHLKLLYKLKLPPKMNF